MMGKLIFDRSYFIGEEDEDCQVRVDRERGLVFFERASRDDVQDVYICLDMEEFDLIVDYVRGELTATELKEWEGNDGV